MYKLMVVIMTTLKPPVDIWQKGDNHYAEHWHLEDVVWK